MKTGALYAKKAAFYGQLPWVADKLFLNRIAETIMQLDPDRILDLGCGWGNLEHVISEEKSYLGVDRSSRMIETAERLKVGGEKHQFLNTNFQRFRYSEAFKGYVIVWKNVLHLERNWIDSVCKFVSDLNKCRGFIIVETVSPSVESLKWVKKLFHEILGANHKVNWFTKGEIEETIKHYLGNKVSCTTEYYEQLIRFEAWLNTYGLSLEDCKLAEEHFDNAIPVVSQDLQMSREGEHHRIFLRLQEIVVVRLNNINK